MPNEITLPGQIVQYGGPTLTLAGSVIGNAVASILTREGTGSGRGWKLFDPTKASFLNTKTVLNDGDYVIVNAKTLPMSFPVKVASNAGDTLVIDIAAGSVQSPESRSYVLNTYPMTLAAPVFKDSSGVVTAGTLNLYLDGGAAMSYVAFNTVIAALAESEYQANTHTYTFSASINANTAGSLELTIQ
jgi:hypothetical protein